MSDEKVEIGNKREKSIEDWEGKDSIIAKKSFTKFENIGLGAIIVILLAGVWYIKHSSGDDAKSGDKNAEALISDKKPVQKLKENAQVAPVKETPPPAPAYDAAKAQREQEALARQEKEQQLLAARQRSSLIATGSDNHASAPVQASGQASGEGSNSSALFDKAGGGAQDANSRFAKAVSNNGIPVSKAEQIDNLPYKVMQGKMIEAVLEPRAVSDLPGMVCATIQRDVFGAQGSNKLIPWGSRVCGVYSAEIKKGQDRLFIVWNNVIRPDGVTVTLDSSGADQQGSAGMGGIIDNHFLEIFGASAAISIIGAGAANVGVNSGDQYNSSSAYRQSVAQSAAQTSQSVLQQYGSIQPTITVPAGSIIRIYINRILDFTPVYKHEIEAEKHDGIIYIQ